MALTRRVLAPFVGLLLALSLALSPVSAAPAQVNGFSICDVLFLIGHRLPDVPAVHNAWGQVLEHFGCQNNSNGQT